MSEYKKDCIYHYYISDPEFSFDNCRLKRKTKEPYGGNIHTSECNSKCKNYISYNEAVGKTPITKEKKKRMKENFTEIIKNRVMDAVEQALFINAPFYLGYESEENDDE